MTELLKVEDLHVSVEEKEILHGLNLTVHPGETHVLLGPNGAGKSTLGNAIMGNPAYQVSSGDILLEGESILEDSTDARAKKGLFMSFQSPLEVPGITLSNFIRSALEQQTGERVRLWDFRKAIRKKMELLNMDETYSDRDLNVGFSGGEKKKSEILQLLMLNPKLAILDETDSGLDVDAVRTVSEGVAEFQKDESKSLIIITHSAKLLEALRVDYTHVLVKGKIVATGDASLVEKINAEGFEQYLPESEREAK
ncbi:MAG TPA: Fe-S cluster assembly ATPase SufC [Clostridiales bacterium]|nr:Fe-S cluster assembly ATPase SufC [Clostridiales bacterium]